MTDEKVVENGLDDVAVDDEPKLEGEPEPHADDPDEDDEEIEKEPEG